MKEKSVQLNAILNVIKTLAVLAFPLITYPYSLRVLGVNNIGAYSFSKSIVNYFSLIAGLGIGRYAIREGARLRDNKEQLNEFASQMFSINVISAVTAYVFLGLFMLVSVKAKEYGSLIFIQSFIIIFTAIGMEWLNSSLEEYKYITVRTIFVQIISIILLFLFVRKEEDIVEYTVVLLLSNIGGYIANLFYIRRRVRLRFSLKNVRCHLSSIMLLFASEVASVIYVNSDMTMLGYMQGDYQVGLYTASSKIYSVAQQVLSAAVLVTLPRLSYYFANRNSDKYKGLVSRAFNLMVINGIPAALGMFLLSDNIIRVFAGADFIESAASLRILCLSLAISLFGILFTNTLLLPMRMEKEVTIIMLIAALVNMGLNLFMIPSMKHIGAAITTVIAETFVMLAQFAVVWKKHYDLIEKKTLICTVVGCLWIAIVVAATKLSISNGVLQMIVAIIVSIIGYYGIQLIMKNRYLVEWKNKSNNEE